MAEETDDSQKTEEPTQRRLEQAREKGQLVSSKEVAAWAMLFAGAVAVMTILPTLAESLKTALLPFIARPHDMPADAAALGTLLLGLLGKVAMALALFAVVMVVMALFSHLVQHGWVISFEPITPKFNKISPFAGLKRLFSSKSLMEFAKGLFKIIIIGAVMVSILRPAFVNASLFIGITPTAMLHKAQELVLHLFVMTLSILGVIAGLDYLYQRFSFLKSMRMSRQELKEEFKDTEGNPEIKAKLRQIRQEKARKRMMAAVPDATVVITNPTHYAIALKYEQNKAMAPVVVAKGVDHIALKIREIAKEHNIPIVENPPLARALYDTAELDEEISFEHYKAVAQVIGYVMRLKKKLGQ
jgi:flagellar biosynthetic protein FlhB